MQTLTLAAGTKEGSWAFYTGSGYLYAASSSSNYLRTEKTLSDNSSWSIEIANDGNATVKAQGEYTRNWLRYNETSSLFAAYANGQKDIALYKVDAGLEAVAAPTGTASGDIKVGDTVEFACTTEGAAIKYKLGDGEYQDYTAPITIDTSVAITVKAVKGGMAGSEEVTFNYEAYNLVDKYKLLETTPADGDKVVIFNAGNNYAVSSTILSSYYLTPVSATVTNNVLSATSMDGIVWDVTKNDNGTYTFKQGDKTLAIDSGTNSKGNTVYNLNVSGTGYPNFDVTTCNYENSSYYLSANGLTGSYGNVYIEYFLFTKTNTPEFSAYCTSTNKLTENDFAFQFYKLTQEKEYVSDEPAEPTYNTIAEALAGENGTSFTVKGVVTLVDDKNIYLQDATGGICLRLSAAPADISLGDTIIGTGSKTVYNGLPQLGSGSYEKSSGLTLSAKATTIDALTAADICTYVSLKKLEITEVYDNSGTYTAPNITVKDGNGKTIQLYKAVINKDSDGAWEYKVGDVIDITAAVSYYQNNTGDGKYQLRNTLASEVKLHTEGEYGKITSADKLVDGTYVMVVSTGYAPLEFSSNWLTAVQPTIENNKVTVSEGAVWTLNVTGNTVTLTDKNGVAIAPKDTATNGITAASYDWTWTFDSSTQTFRFKGDSVTLASNNSTDAQYGGFNKFRAYKDSTVTSQKYPCDFTLYSVDPDSEIPVTPSPSDVLTVGSKVMIYNQNAKAVLAEEGSSKVIEKALATVTDGEITEVENGGVLFTVEKNGDYYRFKNKTYGYLCSNGTGNNAFYSKDFSEEGVSSEDADWTVRTCSGDVGGYELESRTAKFNGRYSQWLEYYSDSFKSYSMYNVTDYTIYSFYFYPVAEGIKLDGDVANNPKVVFTSGDTALKGCDYTLTFYIDDINTIDQKNINVKDFNGSIYNFKDTEDGYSATIPASYLVGEKIVLIVTIKNDDGIDAYEGKHTVTILDEPSIGEVTPAANSQTGDNKKPVISADVFNAGTNPTITMTLNGTAVNAAFANGKVSYTPANDMADGKVIVTLTVTRADDKVVTKTWSFTVGRSQFQLYFGQLHSHTQYSDGSGSLESALSYVESLPASANVQFVAFTDHSNYFDGSKAGGTANPEGALYDMSLASSDSQKLWNSYKSAVTAFNERNADSMVALAGFEMTWSGGPGHINTFNTPGIVSRNNATLNNKTDDAGMKAYYSLLSQSEGAASISQFNHPGSTFGTFSDFAYWDAVIDSRIYLVEVGNGEGQIGSGGYYPSYEYYTMALDKGWHVAPTNNQDNHKGKWGNANDARDVILTDNFTEEGIYEALRALRVYSTEDKNLSITYTVNGEQLGSQIVEVPEKLAFDVSVFDPDSSDSISKVEIIVNSGKVAYTWNKVEDLQRGEFSVELDPEYSYYYIRVTQADGDLAVTAPVWVGESLMLGISDVKCSASTPVTGEELTLTTTFFNSESIDAKVKSITYTTNGSEVIGTDNTGVTINANSTGTAEFKYTPTKAKVMTITVTAVIEQDGKEYTFSKDIELDIGDADKLVYIGIDASHYNEYVAGNYKDSMGNFSNLAAKYSVRTVELATSADLIAACSNDKYKALILTAPSRRNGDALRNPYSTYSDDEIAAIKAFNEKGGVVILAGWSDHYESYTGIKDIPVDHHMAAQQNKILAALGSSLRIGDDATYDDVVSKIDGVDPYRLYFNTYNFDNFLADGIIVDPDNDYDRMYTEVFSHYGGASIYTVDGTLPGTVSPLVYGHSSTYSKDTDSDGLGDSTPKYTYAEGDDRLMIMASEQLDGQGLIVVSGAAFMSNFEVQATIEDNGSEKNYSNYRICENLLRYINPITMTPIKDVQAEEEEGVKYTIEGVVTSNASGYDADTAFFDCIYVQDETAGINAFPVAGNYKIGDKVRITGTTSSYQGERQIAVSSIEKLGEATPVEPVAATAKQINDGSLLGSLVKVSGTITKVEVSDGLIQTILVKDKTGTCRLFIDGYITTSKDVEGAVVGANVEAVGLSSYDNTFVLNDGTAMAARIRIRDRADIVCTAGSGSSSGSSVGGRANITLTANSAELKYNGSEQSVTGLVDNTFTYGGKVYTVTGLTVGANGTDAGTYNTAVSGRATVKDAQGNDLTRLFNIVVTTGTLTIAKRDVTLTSANAQKLYDGKALTADAVTATGDGFAEGEGAVFTVTGTQTKAGESANSFSYALTDATKAANYNITTVDGKLTVSKRSVTLTSASDSKCYDGKALTNDTVTVSGDGFAEGEGAVFTVTGKQTRIGESANSFTYTLKPGTDAANYSITTVVGKLKVVNFPFTDVATNAWCFEAIDYLWRNDIVKGVSATEYDPDGTLSRAMFVTMLYRIAGSPDVSGLSAKFTDIDIDWAHDAIIWACNANVTKGISATEFAPDLEIDRAMIVTMLYRFCGSPAVSGSISFKDAADIPDYAKDAVIWATQNGIINGYTDNTFRPTNTATRAEAAAMLYRFITK